MKYEISTEAYEGPFDLLLSLIDKNKIDIYDIPVHIITEQFIAHIQLWEEMNLEVASDFILMAATLLEIKSKMLLPQETTIVDGDEVEIDPRDELVKRLVEYKLFKEIADGLKKSESIFSRVYYKPQEDVSDFRDPFDELTSIQLKDLVETLNGILERFRYSNPSEEAFQLEREEISMEECTCEIQGRLYGIKSFKFSELFAENRSRSKIIAYFLSLLEMMRMRLVLVKQDLRNSDLIIEKRS
jgi:segregation and condensation protein A